MQPKLLFETAVLLALSQFVLGVVGYLLKGIPWAALPVVFFLGWMIVRTARVFREEMGRAVRRGVPMTPWITALAVAVLWQLPALACVPAWAPYPAIRLWQGALLPIPGTLELLGGQLAVEPLLWVLVPCEMLLFVSVATRHVMPVRRVVPQSGLAARVPTVPGGTGEWAPARRRKDIKRRAEPEFQMEVEPEANPDAEE